MSDDPERCSECGCALVYYRPEAVALRALPRREGDPPEVGRAVEVRLGVCRDCYRRMTTQQAQELINSR